MSERPSLRGRLVWAFVSVVLPLLAVLLLAVHLLVARRLEADLVERTAATGRLVVGLLEFDPEDGLELEGDDAIPRVLSAAPEPTFVWIDTDGRSLAAPTAAFGPSRPDCVDPKAPSAARGRLEPGARVAVWCARVAFPDAGIAPPPAATVTLARDVGPTRTTLLAIDGILAASGLATILAAIGAAAWATRRGLAPIDDLRAAIAELERHGQRIDVRGRPLPVELRPLMEALDRALDRLARTYERERESASRIAHELRTPIAAMRTEIEVLLARPSADVADVRACLCDLLEEIEALGRTIDVLLASRRARTVTEQGRSGPTDAAPIVGEVVAVFEPEARTRGQSFELHAVPTPVEADPMRLRIVLGNLVSNAVRHGRPGTPIVIRLSPDPSTVAVIENRCERHSTEAGTGLGLAIARDVAAGDGLGVDLRLEGDRAVARVVRTAESATPRPT